MKKIKLKINNVTLLPSTTKTLSSSFLIYFLCICHLGSFPIVYEYSNLYEIKCKIIHHTGDCLIIYYHSDFSGDGLSKKQDILVIMASHEGVGMFDMIVEKQLLTDIISTLSVSECGQRVSFFMQWIFRICRC